MGKGKKDAKKASKKAARSMAAPAGTTPSARMLSEQKASVVVTSEDGSPLFIVRNVLLNTQCPTTYSEGSLALFGTYTAIDPKTGS